jgi:hypothetical protein
MKKFIYSLVLVISLGMSSTTISAATNVNPKPELTTEQKIQFERITRRVEEIRKMDKSSLSQVERKALRSELKEMKAQAKQIKGGVYLSVGAIIIIILLLILIL